MCHKIYGMLLPFWTPSFLFRWYVQLHLKTDPLVGELFNKQLFMIVIRLKYMYFFIIKQFDSISYTFWCLMKVYKPSFLSPYNVYGKIVVFLSAVALETHQTTCDRMDGTVVYQY